MDYKQLVMNLNPGLLFAIPLCWLLVRGVRKFADTPRRLPAWDRRLRWYWVPAVVLFAGAAVLGRKIDWLDDAYLLLVVSALVLVLLRVSAYRPVRTLLLAGLPLYGWLCVQLTLLITHTRFIGRSDGWFNSLNKFLLLWLVAFFFVARKQKANAERERVEREAQELERQRITAQNVELEQQVAERTAALLEQAEALRQTVTELTTTQAQLVQAEKMASLGELTAGIAHEIQNPLNFVNNFAEVSTELVAELADEQLRPARDFGLEAELLTDLKQNLLKISQHGQRAASIVRGMLEHSRTSSGERTPTDLNQLADEYLRLAYHGLRAKDKSFNATLLPDFEPGLPPVAVVAQDVGRVLLNLLTNAFYAVRQRQQQSQPHNQMQGQPAAGGEAGYAPTVGVRTRRVGTQVEIRVTDNGTGIPAEVQAKIFQPFFTTKPTGEGTGLGLSLSYDIITKGHGGTLSVESEPGRGSTFTIALPG